MYGFRSSDSDYVFWVRPAKAQGRCHHLGQSFKGVKYTRD